MTHRHLLSRLLALAITGALVTACADTVIDVESDSGEINVEGSSATVPTTTLPIVGSTDELLTEMSSEMSRLSSEIGDPGDEKATLARIQSIWDVARPDVETSRADLVNGIDTTVDMATTAVVRIRPADADKALKLLNDLIERFAGAS